jgi:hypothetical protein
LSCSLTIFFLGNLILFMASTMEISRKVITDYLHVAVRAGDQKVDRRCAGGSRCCGGAGG